MPKIVKYVGDLFAVLILVGSVYFIVVTGDAEQKDTTVRGVLVTLAAVCFFTILLASLLLATKVTWGLWDTDPESTRLKRIYRVPFLSAIVAYIRLRTGRGIAIQKPPRQKAWTIAQTIKKQQNKSEMATPRKPSD